jgi:Fe-S-cluster containining protein
MVTEIPFNCLKCGKCCSNLLQNKGRTGLMIHKDETQLFPKEVIEPHLAIGTSPNHESFQILTYQLNIKKCPKLKNSICTTYQRRPLICRGFPLKIKEDVPGKYEYEMSHECTAVEILQKKHSRRLASGQVEITFSDEVELASLRKSNNKLFEFWVPPSNEYRKWVFNLKTGKWREYKKQA